MIGVSVKIERNAFNGAAGRVRTLAGGLAQRSAYRIVEDAKANVRVDTGETRDHIEAIKVGLASWEVISTRPSSDAEVNVPALIEYGSSTMPASPYMRPAAERERPRFEDEARALLGELF